MIPAFCTGLIVGLVLGAALVALACDRTLRRSTIHRAFTVTLGADDRLRITTDPRLHYERSLTEMLDAFDKEHMGGKTW